MASKKTVIICALLAVACLSVGAVIGSVVTLYWVSGSGVIKLPPTIGVYAEPGCTESVQEIDWGTLSPGDVAKKVVYIRNEGTYPVTLSLSTTNWNPSHAQQYLSCTWDYASQPIAMNAVIAITFSLAVSSNITRSSGITTFSYDIVLTVQG